MTRLVTLPLNTLRLIQRTIAAGLRLSRGFLLGKIVADHSRKYIHYTFSFISFLLDKPIDKFA